MEKRYLVTGGFGFIGNELVRQLRDRKYPVAIFDNQSRLAPHIEDLDQIPCFKGSILESTAIEQAIKKFEPTSIIHYAAMHYIPECNANPVECMEINLIGTMRVAKAAQNLSVKQFVFASSGAVYADSADALTESSLISPIDIYGASKLAAEEALKLSFASGDMKIIIARIFNNYGPRETNAHIIPEILSQLKKGRTLSLGNIDTERDFILTSDCSRAVIDLSNAELDSLEAFNIATGVAYSIRDLINLIAEIQGSPIHIEIDKARYRKADKQTQVADIRKLEKTLGWAPSTPFRKGLEELLKFESKYS